MVMMNVFFLLFGIYINALNDDILNISKFTVDDKMCGVVDSGEGYLNLQQDVDQLGGGPQNGI